MKPIVKLKDVIPEMDIVGHEQQAFLNIQTGELITFSDDDLRAAEKDDLLPKMPNWQKEIIQKGKEILFSGDYRELPSKFDIHEYRIMQNFCCTIKDEELSERLLNSIRGRGAFRYFKDTLYQYGFADDWYKYREQAFKKIATEWLDSQGIPYIDEATLSQRND